MRGGDSAICKPFCLCQQVDPVHLIKSPVAQRVNALTRPVLHVMVALAQRHYAVMALWEPAWHVCQPDNVVNVNGP